MKKIGEWVWYSLVMLFVIGVWAIQSWYILALNFDLVVDLFAIIGFIVTVRFFWKQYKNSRRPRD